MQEELNDIDITPDIWTWFKVRMDGAHAEMKATGAICGSLGRVTDMRPVHLEDLTSHYVRTLEHWRRRFRANIDNTRALGFSEEFLRLWQFYFCYCEAGFRERIIGDVQLLLCKPDCRRDRTGTGVRL